MLNQRVSNLSAVRIIGSILFLCLATLVLVGSALGRSPDVEATAASARPRPLTAQVTTPLTLPVAPQSNPVPLPRHCDGVTPPGIADPCCMYGYIYFNGQAVAGVQVHIQAEHGYRDTVTAPGLSSGTPYYMFDLASPPISATLGSVVTITASYNGMVTSRTWIVQPDGQQVDLGLLSGYQAPGLLGPNVVAHMPNAANSLASGRITDGSASPVSGVLVSAGSSFSATTDTSGYYTLTNLITGTYTLTPTKSGYTFSPATRTVSVPPDATGQDFVTVSPWPMFLHDARRTGRSSFVGPDQPYLKWSYSIPGVATHTSPAIAADGTIYVGSNDNRLHAINSNGTRKWIYTTTNVIGSSPAVATDGTVYFGSNGGNLFALNPDGSLQWSYSASDIRSSPAISPDGSIYFGGGMSARLFALNPTGTLKWVYQPGVIDSGYSPAIGPDGTLYIPSANNRGLDAVNPGGTNKWSYPLCGSGYMGSSPSVDSTGTIYIGDCDHTLYAINPTGTLKWSHPLTGTIYAANQAATFGPDGTVYVVGAPGVLHAFTPAGTLKWTYATGAGGAYSISPVVDANGIVYFGGGNGAVYAIRPDGTAKWIFQASADWLGASIAIDANHTLYVTGNEGVFAIGGSEQLFADAGAALPGVDDYGSAAWGDSDNDGDLDVLLVGCATYSGGCTNRIGKVYRNDGNGVFADSGITVTGVTNNGVAWGDYNNDGNLDILLTGMTDSTRVSKLYRNEGGGVFTDINAALLAVASSSVVWGDYNNDGRSDILLAGYTNQGSVVTKLYRNDGGGAFTEVPTSLPAEYYGAMAWGDYNNDGNLDVAMGGSASQPLKIYRGDGNGSFTDIGVSLGPIYNAEVAWGDYDNDGYLDIAVTGETASPLSRIYHNNGNDTFTDIGAALTPVTYGSVAWGDYDNDGNLDLLLTGYGEIPGTTFVSKVYRNDGGGVFTDIGAGLTGVGNYSSGWWGDYDNDGKLDILLTGNSGSGYVTKIYRNTGATSNTAPTAPTNLSTTTAGNQVTFRWDSASDAQTISRTLTYNLRVGTTPGGSQIVGPMANTVNGYRRLPALGNAQHGLTATLTLSSGTYYWSVQAIDTTWAGSAFASEGSFTIGGGGPTTFSIAGRVTDGGNPIGGVTLSGGSGLNTTTDAGGYYTFTNLITGTYTLTPTKSGYTFTPITRMVSVPPNATGQNFVGATNFVPPAAQFVALVTSGSAPLAVQFVDQSTGDMTSWTWHFGDGFISGARYPKHDYESAGLYTVDLTVVGASGSDISARANYIAVYLTAQFDADPKSGVAPLTVAFANQSTGIILSSAWNFGDGGSSSQINPTHTYTIPGVYTVMLTVNSPGGSDSETKVNYITVAPPPITTTAWTFMLYLAGDNNLGGTLQETVDDLERVANNPNVNIVVLYDSWLNNDTRLYHLTYNTVSGINALPIPVGWNPGELNMGDPQTLIAFVDWARASYPAQHYLLAMADHGRGTSGIAWDSTSGPEENIRAYGQLGGALNTVTLTGTHKLDVLYLDACLMGMLEDAYEVKGSVDYLVASENLGWSVFTYDQYVSGVGSTTTPRQLAQHIADTYFSALYGYPGTVAALDLSVIANVGTATDNLAQVLRSYLSPATSAQLIALRGSTQVFDSRNYNVIDPLDDEYIDLYHFADLISTNITSPTVQSAAQAVKTAITDAVVAEHHQSGTDVWSQNYWNLAGAHGLSIYFPPRSGGWDYINYVSGGNWQFTGQTAWDQFLLKYFQVSGLPWETASNPGVPLMQGLKWQQVFLPVIKR